MRWPSSQAALKPLLACVPVAVQVQQSVFLCPYVLQQMASQLPPCRLLSACMAQTRPQYVFGTVCSRHACCRDTNNHCVQKCTRQVADCEQQHFNVCDTSQAAGMSTTSFTKQGRGVWAAMLTSWQVRLDAACSPVGLATMPQPLNWLPGLNVELGVGPCLKAQDHADFRVHPKSSLLTCMLPTICTDCRLSVQVRAR